MKPDNPSQSRVELRDFEVVIPTVDGTRIAERIPVKIPMEWDPEMQQWLITPEGEASLENTKARHMGLILPEELRALRTKLCLTQSEIGDLLGIGEKTWTRWETGHQRPSQSLNLLLCAVQKGLLSVYDLRRLRDPRIDWSPVLATRDLVKRQPSVAMDIAWALPCIQSWPQPTAEAQIAPLAA